MPPVITAQNNQGPSNAPNTVLPPVAAPVTNPIAAPVATPAAAPSPATGSQSPEDQVAISLGYKDYADAVGQLTAPTKGETETYNSAYKAAGLDGLASTIAGKKNALATAQDNINDNPWLDEASRVGRNNTVQTLANADIKNYQDEYDTKIKEVEDLVTREGNDNTANSTANKAKLAALESQAKELATQAAATQKASTTAPTTIKGANGATYQWNAATGKFTQILGGKAAAPTAAETAQTKQQQLQSTIDGINSSIQKLITTTGGQNGRPRADKYLSPEEYSAYERSWVAAGYSPADFAASFGNYQSPNKPK